MRFILALGLLLLTWGLVGLVAGLQTGHARWPWSGAKPRAESPHAIGGMAPVDFSNAIIFRCPAGPDILIPSPRVAIVFVSTGSLAMLLALVAHRLREGPMPPPRSLRRDALDGERARRVVRIAEARSREGCTMPSSKPRLP